MILSVTKQWLQPILSKANELNCVAQATLWDRIIIRVSYIAMATQFEFASTFEDESDFSRVPLISADDEEKTKRAKKKNKNKTSTEKLPINSTTR